MTDPGTQPKPPQPIHTDIPVDRAWRVGRRVYIKTGKTSKLNEKLIALNATWDGEVGARWVGTGKLEIVTPMILDHLAVIAKLEAIKADGRWAVPPRGADSIHTLAQQLRGVWDKPNRRYAMPSDEALEQMNQAIADWNATQRRERLGLQIKQEQMQAAQPTATITTAQVREQQLIDACGRQVTDERGEKTLRVTGHMRRPDAERRSPKPGDIRRIRGGRRVLVLSRKVWFASQDMIDDGAFLHPAEDPGWRCDITYAVLTPTAKEIESDHVEAAEAADLKEIDDLMTAVNRDSKPTTVDSLSRLDGPSITTDSPGSMSIHGGKVTVTDDGVFYQHPGFYDCWTPSQWQVTDPGLLARIAAVLALGERRQGRYLVQP